jgi:hypothetical protein
VENYFNYFTEIEEQFQRRRGGSLLLSTLDWALIETWKDAGIPLEAVLRGIDSAFEKYEKRPSRSQKVNSLAYCAQAVLTAAEDMKEAAVGVSPESNNIRGFQAVEISAYLTRNAASLEAAALSDKSVGRAVVDDSIASLRKLATGIASSSTPLRLEDLERHLTVLEDKLYAVLLTATPDDEIVAVRSQAERELAPYRNKMPTVQIQQLQKQYLQKRLLEKYKMPRLSLFYM